MKSYPQKWHTLRAGADMFLVCHSEEQSWTTYEAVLHEAERDRRFAKIVQHRARRVRDAKKKMRELKPVITPPSDRDITRLRDQIEQFRGELAKAEAARL